MTTVSRVAGWEDWYQTQYCWHGQMPGGRNIRGRLLLVKWCALIRVMKHFITETVRVVMATEKALIVTKGINWFPSNEDKCRGNIDIWWVVRILWLL